MRKEVQMTKYLYVSLVLLFLLNLTFINIGSAPPTTTYKVEPVTSTARVGDTFTVQVNVYDATDLYAWQVFINWTGAVLQPGGVGVVIGDFLAGQPAGTTPSVRLEATFAIIGETTNGANPGVDGDGWLCSITFEVLSLATTALNIDSSFTTALDSSLVDIVLIKQSGNYVPPLPEDINADGAVDIFDLASVAIWVPGTVPPAPLEVDINNDGDVNVIDLTLVSIKFGTYAGV